MDYNRNEPSRGYMYCGWIYRAEGMMDVEP